MNKKIKMQPNFLEDVNVKRYYYIDFGYETHGKRSFRLWLTPHCLKMDKKGNPYIEFPAIGCKIKQGRKKGSYILIPDIKYWTAIVKIPCGYRGEGWIEEFISPKESELIIVKFYEYHSPRGSLGVDTGYLISIPLKYELISYRWKKTGRLYGGSSMGCEAIYKTGEVKEIPCPEDIEDIEEDIKEIEENIQDTQDILENIKNMMQILAQNPFDFNQK